VKPGKSIQGLKAAWCNEAAFRQECALLAIAIFITVFLPVGTVEKVLSGRAKDIGSAAVLIALLLAAFTWVSILGGAL